MWWRWLLLLLAAVAAVAVGGTLLFSGSAVGCSETVAAGPAVACAFEVAAPPAEVWEAFAATGVSRPYFFDAVLQAELVPGGRWRFVTDDRERLLAGGTVLAVEPQRRFVHTFEAADLADPPSRIAVTLEPVAGGTRVELLHDGFAGRTETFRRFRRAHPLALSALASFVETGEIPLRARLYTALFEPGMKLFTVRAEAWPDGPLEARPASGPAAPSGSGPAVALEPLLAAGLEHGFPGIAVAVSRGGGEPRVTAAGHADLEREVPLRPEHAFHLASVTPDAGTRGSPAGREVTRRHSSRAVRR